MPPHIYITDHAGDLVQEVYRLLYIDFPTPLYFVDSEIDVWTDASAEPGSAPAARWKARGFTTNGIGSEFMLVGAGSSIDIADDNFDLSSYIWSGAEIVDTIVRMYHAYFDPDANLMVAEDTKIRYEGRIEKPSKTDLLISLTLAPLVEPARIQLSADIIQHDCDFIYKKIGGQCQAVSSLPTCDKTELGPNGCVAHGNRINFGGVSMVGI